MFRRALKASQDIGDLESEAQLLMNLGVLSNYLQKSDEILGYYNSAIQIANDINDWSLIQAIAGKLGFFYEKAEDYYSAKLQFYKVFIIAVKFKDYQSAAYYGSRYAQMCYWLREFNEAVKVYDETEKYAKIVNDPVLLLRLKISKGDIYFYLNQLNLAKHIFQEVLKTAIDNNLSKQQHIAKVRLANVMVRRGEYKEPRKAYQDYIDFINKKNLHRTESEAYWLWKLSQTYLLEKKYSKARTLSLQALESAKKHNKNDDYRWCILRLAELDTKTENYSEALKWYDEILSNIDKKNIAGVLPDIYLGIGNVYRKQSKLEKAIPNYILSAKLIEKTRQNLQIDQFKIGYFKDEYRVYKNIVQCYLRLYLTDKKEAYLDSLFKYDQMARGRTLQELTFQKGFEKLQTSDDKVYTQYTNSCLNLQKKQRLLRLPTKKIADVDELRSQLSQIDADKYSIVEQRLRLVKNTTLKNNSKESFICSLPTVTQKMQESKLGLLIYNISEESSFVFVIGDSLNTIVPLQINPQSIEASIDSLMTPFHDIKQDSVKFVKFRAVISYHLYKLLIQPIEEKIKLPDKLLIVADHILLKLPFEMLLCSKPKASEYTPTDFPDYSDNLLLQRYSLSYAPSIWFLKENPQIAQGENNFLMYANPFTKISFSGSYYNQLRSLTGWDFAPLPNADNEANSIKGIIKNSKIIRHDRATETSLFNEAPNKHFIHLATHGFVDISFDAFSGIVLATDDDSTSDGILSGYEIANLDLRKCDLITLSACETGRGEVVAGEGVLGLPRLFLGAGAKSVLMTLWKVDDRFTSKLMPIFYKNLFEKKLSKVEALSQAKRELIKKNEKGIYYQHPFYWASFCMFGEPRSSERISFINIRLILVILSIMILILFIVILSIKVIRTKNYH